MNPVKHLSQYSLAIFLFHGVIEESRYEIRNYKRKHIEKNNFWKILKDLKAKGHALSMDDVVFHLKNQKQFPAYSYAITFDDGFENNCSIAAPLLSDLNIPAMFYVTTDFIENNSMSWIDRIEFCFERVSNGELDLPFGEKKYTFKEVKHKKRILDHIRHHVKNDSSINVGELVSSVFDQLSQKEVFKNDDPLDLKMNWKQVVELKSHPLMTIGGHTHTHQIMSFLNTCSLQFEISKSLELLWDKAQIKPYHYSYPEGQENCYNDKVIEELKKMYVKCCPTAIQGMNTLDEDLFHLKRIMVD